MLEALFSPESAQATADVVSGVSDLGVTGIGAVLAYKVFRLAEAAKDFLEAQTKAINAVSTAAESVGDVAKQATQHIESTRTHQKRLEEILESAA